MNDLLHIASFVIQHRPEAAAVLDAALAAMPDTELALRDGGRSIVLCEGNDEAGLVTRMESLRDIDGVMVVNLVHHHAESRESLLQEI
jgi:periplasmic nitrate reductase NapD